MRVPFLLTLLFAAAAADAAVYKCVGADGRTTFTDRACPEAEQQGTVAIKPPPPSALKAQEEAKTEAERQAKGDEADTAQLMSDARARCEAGLGGFVKGKYPDLEGTPRGGIIRPLERRIQGEEVEVKFLGNLRFTAAGREVTADIECAALRSGQGEWHTDYRESASQTTLSVKKK